MKNSNYRTYDPETLKKLQDVEKEILGDFIRVCDKNDLDYFITGGSLLGTIRHQGFIPWDDDTDVCMPRKDYERFLKIWNRELGDKYDLLTPLTDKRYACNVTHLMKKGTTFVPMHARDLKCHIGIYLDIFPLDNMPDDKKLMDKQIRKTWFWNKLLFLCGTPRPYIPLKGAAGVLASAACYVIHWGLKIFHISTQWIYRNIERESQKYNNTPCKAVNSFRSATPRNAFLYNDEIYPLGEKRFEDLTVKVPGNYDSFLTRMYGDYMKLPPEEKRVNHCPYKLKF